MENFDAIVVGAGPAGCAAAYTMAKAGLNILVLERGKYAGAKNMWGGALFGSAMNEVFPEFWKEAPVERSVSRHAISFLTKDASLSIDFKNAHRDSSSCPGFIILRAKFDQWLAGQVEKAGAIIASGLEVDDFIREGQAIRGVKVAGEEFPANLVILADGANSLLAAKTGLRGEFKAQDLKQGVKEVLRLPREVIEDRFNLKGTDGAVMEFVGHCTLGLPGGGFIYTNLDSLSVGVVVQLSALLEKRLKASDLIEGFKAHPFIQNLIRGGELLEYSAHLIPVSGVSMMPRLYGDGIMITGDAAAMVLGTGLILEGANFAVAAGVAAGNAAIRAREKKDYSPAVLQSYEQALKDTFVIKDLNTFREAPHFLENRRIYNDYPEWACDLMSRIFCSDGKPRKNTFQVVRESMKGRFTVMQLLSDFLRARRAM
ncbi:MAG TPA: FAD-dependent oxidoreductase [Syntrophales bacterium]|nr:FAD-dependent oxidoreductase [Syntrophales bacterium]HOX94944.1 FAD-dependent oxidoreductase [Syntrophales bacterium]HPI58232.1 FAD-dependent oxidoreductase [Syntrophales bacterium]HPN25598.1 FAD-dependent oxidoreductase [Syntrophales bacterium]HQM28144.1 FAD-dependent oxidoreductase [Syntrophales bacterium]